MAITIQQLACAKYLKDFHQFACHIDTGNWIVGNTHDPTNRIKHWGKLPKDSFIGYGNWDYHDIKEKDIFDAFWRLVWIIEYKSQERFFCSIQDAFERLLNSVVLKERSCSSTDLIEGLGRYELFCKAIMECFGIIDNLNNKESSTAFEREKLAYKNNRFANGAKHDYLDKFVKFNHQSHIANIRSIRNELIHNDQSSFADHKHIHAFLREELLALVLFTFDLTHGADHTLDEGFLRHEDNKKNSQNVRVNVQIRSDRHSDWEQIAVFYDKEGTLPVQQIDQNASTANYSFDAEYFEEYFIGAKRQEENGWTIVEDKPFVPEETAIGELWIEVFPSNINKDDLDFNVQLENYRNVQLDKAAVTHEELKELQKNLNEVVDESIKAEIDPVKDQLITLYYNLQKQEANKEKYQELDHNLQQTRSQVNELNQAFDQYKDNAANATEQFKTKLQASNKSLDELNQTVLSHDIRIKELEEQLEEEKVKLRNLGITIEDLREYVKYIATEQGEKIDNLKDYVDKVKKETSKINSVLKVFACVGATLIAGGATVVACKRLWCYKVAEWWLSNNLAVGGGAGVLLIILGLSLFTLCKLKNIHWGWKTLPIIAVIAMGTIVCRMPAYTLEGLHNRMVDEHATFDEGLYLMAHNLGDNDAAYWCAERIEKNLLKEVNNAGSDSSLSVVANSDLPAKACKYYRLAKERYESILAGGSIDATMAYRLAMMYLTGKGGEYDPARATRYAAQAQSHPMGAALYAYCCYQVGDMQEMRSQMKLIEAGQVGNKEDILYNLLKVLDEIDEIRNTDMTGKDITVLKQKASDCVDKLQDWENAAKVRHNPNPILSIEAIGIMGSGIQTADGQALVPRSFSGYYNLLLDRSVALNNPLLQFNTGNMLLDFGQYKFAELYFLTAWHNGLRDAAVKLVEMADLLYPDAKKPEWYEDAHSVLKANWTGEVSSYIWKANTFYRSGEISEGEHQLDMAIELAKSQSKYKEVYTSKNWWSSIVTTCLNTNNFQKAYEIAMKELVDSTVNHGFKYYLRANQYAKGYGVEKDIHKADSLLRIAVDSACHEAKITNMCLKQRTGVTLITEDAIDMKTGKRISYSSYSLPGDIEELGKTDDRAKDIQLLYYWGRTLRGDELVDDFNYYHNIPTYEYMEGITQSDYERIAGPAYDHSRPVYAHVLYKMKRAKSLIYFGTDEYDIEKHLILSEEIVDLLDDNVAANMGELSRATIYNLGDMLSILVEGRFMSNTWTPSDELITFNLLNCMIQADTEIGLWTAKNIYTIMELNGVVDLRDKLLKSYPQLMKAKEPSEKEIFMPDPWLL